MLRDYSPVFREDNLEHVMVLVENGELVTNVAMAVRPISFEGAALTVGLVGAVGTAERCRGRGYATKALDALLDKAAREGVDLAWISGGRGLYTSRGAAKVGRQRAYTIKPGALPEGLRLREMTRDDLEAAIALYDREPVRFVRPRDDWLDAWDHQFALNSKARFWCVWRAGRLSAYLIVHEKRPDRPAASLAEFAGNRSDAAAALPEVAKRMVHEKVQAHVGDWDEVGRAAFGRVARGEAQAEDASGLFLPIRMVECMERLRSRIAKHCGDHVAREVRFSESGKGAASRAGKDDILTIGLGDRQVRILGRAQVARLIFGTPENARPAFEGSAEVMTALQPAFPLPTPWYGLNFV